MITTITLNPSVDRRYMVEDFEKGRVFRTTEYAATAGGKGLNVTRVAHCLGASVIATGLLGGNSGEFIQKELDNAGISHKFLVIEEETRSCIAILTKDGEQTEILESGAWAREEDVSRFLQHYENLLIQTSVVTASGSLMRGMPVDLYARITKLAKKRKIPFLLDTSGEALLKAINASPTLIKPNQEELEALLGKTLLNESDLITATKELAEQIETVVVSRGGEGSLVAHKGKLYRVRIPNVSVKNPVGSGDSMVAGFAVGMLRCYDFQETLAFATSCGTANAMEVSTGFVQRESVSRLMKQVEILAL
jgi:tagatose 6-phosphate kinase